MSILGVNWMTTLGGLLAGLPVLIMNSGFVLPPAYQKILSIIGGLGTLLVGLAAKQYNVHSTVGEVQDSTNKVAAAKGEPTPVIVTKEEIK